MCCVFSGSQLGLFKEFYLSCLKKNNSINSKILSNKFENQFLFSIEKMIFRKRYSQRILDFKKLFQFKRYCYFCKTVET